MLLDAKDGPGDFDTERRNTLVVRNLKRSDLHAKFTCQASNNNISQPVSASVAIEMHCEYITHFLSLGFFGSDAKFLNRFSMFTS